MNASTSYRVRVFVEPREDGGLRAWSDDVPELVLSNADAEKVIADILPALEVILSARLGSRVTVEELSELPPVGSRQAAEPALPHARANREFAARAA